MSSGEHENWSWEGGGGVKHGQRSQRKVLERGGKSECIDPRSRRWWSHRGTNGNPKRSSRMNTDGMVQGVYKTQ